MRFFAKSPLLNTAEPEELPIFTGRSKRWAEILIFNLGPGAQACPRTIAR
jgi:hypothetical protein